MLARQLVAGARAVFEGHLPASIDFVVIKK